MLRAAKSIPRVCAKDFQALFVGGFGADREEVRSGAWQLCKILYDYSERQRFEHYGRVRSVVNKAANLTRVDEENVNEIRKFIVDTESRNGIISRAVFAHCHGAKIVKEALNPLKLTQYLSRTHHCSEQEAKIRVENIRENMAIFVMGGIDRIPHTRAKIVVNMRLVQDTTALLGETLFGARNKPDVLVYDDDDSQIPESNREVEMPSHSHAGRLSYHQNVSSYNQFNSWFTAFSAAGTGQTERSISYYMGNDNIMRGLLEILSLDDDA